MIKKIKLLFASLLIGITLLSQFNTINANPLSEQEARALATKFYEEFQYNYWISPKASLTELELVAIKASLDTTKNTDLDKGIVRTARIDLAKYFLNKKSTEELMQQLNVPAQVDYEAELNQIKTTLQAAKEYEVEITNVAGIDLVDKIHANEPGYLPKKLNQKDCSLIQLLPVITEAIEFEKIILEFEKKLKGPHVPTLKHHITYKSGSLFKTLKPREAQIKAVFGWFYGFRSYRIIKDIKNAYSQATTKQTALIAIRALVNSGLIAEKHIKQMIVDILAK